MRVWNISHAWTGTSAVGNRPYIFRSEPRATALTQSSKGTDMFKLTDRGALITGGSSGIGLATAKRFVKEGAYVFINGRIFNIHIWETL
jgi:hypothetical protein